MSALQDILDKMYVDPELLEHLAEEQKLLLFIKIREEQVRRWKVNENRLENEPNLHQNNFRNKNGKRVQDGEIWVWVMGEHSNDRSIEAILENEVKEKARLLAEREVFMESLELDNSFSDSTNTNEKNLKTQLLQMHLIQDQKSQESSTLNDKEKNIAEGVLHVNDNSKNFVTQSDNLESHCYFPASNGFFFCKDGAENNNILHSKLLETKVISEPNTLNINEIKLENLKPPPIPIRPIGLRRENVEQSIRRYTFDNLSIAAFPVYTNSTNNRNINPNSNVTINDNSDQFFTNNSSAFDGTSSSGLNVVISNLRQPDNFLNKSNNVLSDNRVSRLSSRLSGEIEDKTGTNQLSVTVTESFKTSENSISATHGADSAFRVSPISSSILFNDQTFSHRHDVFNAFDKSQFINDPMVRLKAVLADKQPIFSVDLKQNNQSHKLDLTQFSENQHLKFRNLTGLKSVDNEIEKRQSRILEQMLEVRDKINEEAEVEAQRQRITWEEQEKKAREAEAQIRLIAQRARHEHLKSLRTSSSLLPVLNDMSCTSIKDAIKNLPRPPKPTNRNAIVQWYKQMELPNRTGFDPATDCPAFWFHGIISRNLAEKLLEDKTKSSFLVRVSERIWGYTVSYVVNEGTSKHFLVEKIPDGYQFLGTNQIVHRSLYDLVTYHKNFPITAKGQETLVYPVGQQTISFPDYSDLID